MEKASNQGKKAPRRNMEARREQNRISSRNYREKRKQKLALLNQLLEPESKSKSSSATSSAPQESSNSSFGTSALIQSDDLIPPQPTTSQEASTLKIDLSDLHDNVPVDLNASQAPSLMPDNLSGLTIPKTSYPSTHLPDTSFNTTFGSFTTDNFASNNDVQWQTVVPYSTSETNLARKLGESFSFPNKGEALHNVLKGLDQLSLNQKQALMLLLQHQIQYATSSPTSSSNSEQHSLDHDNINSCLAPHTKMQLEALEFSFALYQTATTGPSRAPSDYAMESGLFSAMFANCYALGMTDIGPLLIDDGWSIFGLGPEVAYHPSQLSVVRAKFRNLAPALRPCDNQLTIPHHPYIDIIPFKSFREKVLEALDHDQPLIDEDILCQDMLTGLVCWGSQRNTFGMDAAVPWDVRSWEPNIWFLQKYPSLVGGWDDEMWKGARWWHSMRDERIHPTPTTPP